jgi:hypothetical protein
MHANLSAAPRRLRRLILVTGLAALPWLAQAQFAMVPAPQCGPPRQSAHEVEQEFRIDASRHLYACYPMRVHRGKLPPLLYGVMMVEVELDAKGNVGNITTVRKPAAAEVGPWVTAMIRQAAPFPAPARMPGGTVRFTETFFVDKSGVFQTHSLTEGQR